MKYWIFQNNQVLGPYEPEELGKIPVFSAESLVCLQGRGGTSMGDWQPAGMLPDLSAALVQANESKGEKAAVSSIAGMPPEPTLKDISQLAGIQEKVAVLEEVVLQLQEGLRAKDAELSAVQQELAGKSNELCEIKATAVEIKRQIAGIEDRLSSVRQFSDTLDKAVEEDRRIGQDVEKQRQILTDLGHDVEQLRCRLDEGKNQPAEILAAVAPLAPASLEENALSSPPPAAPVPAPAPVIDPPITGVAPIELLQFPAIDVEHGPFLPGAVETKGMGASVDPILFDAASSSALMPEVAPAPDGAPAPKGKKTLLIGGILGLVALGGLVFIGVLMPDRRRVQAPAPIPAPSPAPLMAAPGTETSVDLKQRAVDVAKAWMLPGNRTLAQVLESLAPPVGNLSPWMAETLVGNRVKVNYFARNETPDAPTIAYEFEVDLDAQTLIGRNAEAKSALSAQASVGNLEESSCPNPEAKSALSAQASEPPEPPKRKPVKIKGKKVLKESALDLRLSVPGDNAPIVEPPADGVKDDL